MKNLNIKRQVLEKSRVFRGSDDGYRRVYINNDQTRQERNRQYILRQELRRRRDAGERDLIIKGNEIVKKVDAAAVGGRDGGNSSKASGDAPS